MKATIITLEKHIANIERIIKKRTEEYDFSEHDWTDDYKEYHYEVTEMFERQLKQEKEFLDILQTLTH